MQLRPYQVVAIDALRAAFAGGARAVLLTAPTGSGKTVIIAALALGAHGKQRRLLIVAHRAELIRQASEKLAAAGIPHGIIAPGHPHLALPIQVGSVQTLARRLARLDQYDLIALDEAHHAVAGSWRKLLDAQPQARLVGLTATPQRLDGRGLGRDAGGPFDALVLGPTVRALVDEGYLVPSRVFSAAQPPNLTRVQTVRGDYDARELAAIMDTRTVTGDVLAHYQRHAAGLSALVFCVSVQHAEDVAHAFRAAGIRAQAAHGGLQPRERERILTGLATGGVQVVCAAELISEGLDVPSVAAVVLLRPTQSLALHLQQVGRGLRPAPGKQHLIVLDHAGNTLRHGFAESARTWTLEGRKARAAAPSVRQCPECYCAHPPASRCPACGHVYVAAAGARAAPATRFGELREISEAAVEAIRAASYAEVMQCVRTVDDLKLVAQARGYHPRWVHHQTMLRPKLRVATQGRDR